MKSLVVGCFVFCLSNVAYAGLFDSVVSQVQQVTQTTQQQTAKQQAEQQQAAQQAQQQQATQQQPAQQQATQQQATQQQTTQSPQPWQQIQSTPPPSPEQPVIAAQYADFKWGMTMSDAKMLLLSKAKIGKSDDSAETCLAPMTGAPDYANCYAMTFPDSLFDTNVTVHLLFTLNSKKLYSVQIGELPVGNLTDGTLLKKLDQKYGQHDQEGSNFLWGNDKKGDSVLISVEDVSYSIFYYDADMVALAQQESTNAKQAVTNEGMSKL